MVCPTSFQVVRGRTPMFPSRQTLSFALILLFLAQPSVRSAPPSGKGETEGGEPLSKEYLTIVKVETHYLVRALERLQETLIEELNGRKEKKIYRQADAVLALLDDFERSLESETSRARLYSRFNEFDKKLHELLDSVQRESKDARALRREAARVESPYEELHFARSAGDTTTQRVQEVFKRQARRLVSAAKELEETAQYALAKEPGDVSPGDFHKLVEASVRFQRAVE